MSPQGSGLVFMAPFARRAMLVMVTCQRLSQTGQRLWHDLIREILGQQYTTYVDYGQPGCQQSHLCPSKQNLSEGMWGPQCLHSIFVLRFLWVVVSEEMLRVPFCPSQVAGPQGSIFLISQLWGDARLIAFWRVSQRCISQPKGTEPASQPASQPAREAAASPGRL